MRELHGVLAFHSTTFPTWIQYISHNDSLIPRSSPSPTVACKSRQKMPGEEARVLKIHVWQCSYDNIAWVCAHIGSLYTLCVITVKW